MDNRLGTIGDLFRRTRTERGVSLGEAADALHVPVRYVHALESDDYAALPPAVYTRALVRAYARYLGLKPSELIDRSVPMRPQDRNPIRPALEPIERPWPISWKAVSAIVGVGLFLVAFAYLQAQYSSFAQSVEVAQRASVESTPTVSIRAAVLLTPFATATSTAQASPAVTATPLAALVVDVRIVERSWLQVWTDGRSVLAEALNPGAQRTFTADQSVRMRVGNANGVDVTVNGSSQGRLGSPGQALDVAWSRE